VSDQRIVSIDGQLVAPEQATISVFDRGLLYGDGCFEVLRTWGGIAVDLDAHLDRMLTTCGALALRVPERAQLAAEVAHAIEAAGPGDHRVRIVVTRGPGGLDRRFAELGPGHRIVIVEPLPALPAELRAAIVDLPLAVRRGHGHKLLAYVEHLVARELARTAGADEAIRLDATGAIVEGATSNVFLVRAGVVLTPPVDAGALPGVTRARVLALCARLEIATDVRPISLTELRAADEWFATSAVRGVVPITALDADRRAPGVVTRRIAAAYVETMRRECDARRGRVLCDG